MKDKIINILKLYDTGYGDFRIRYEDCADEIIELINKEKKQ
jgi:hypothetical protein